jgi:hypothetical protein
MSALEEAASAAEKRHVVEVFEVERRHTSALQAAMLDFDQRRAAGLEEAKAEWKKEEQQMRRQMHDQWQQREVQEKQLRQQWKQQSDQGHAQWKERYSKMQLQMATMEVRIGFALGEASI